MKKAIADATNKLYDEIINDIKGIEDWASQKLDNLFNGTKFTIRGRKVDLSIFIVSLAALVIPIVMARFRINAIPTAVAEIVTGIILGKSLLDTIKITSILLLFTTSNSKIIIFRLSTFSNSTFPL